MTLYEVELVEPYTITKWYHSKNNFDLSKKMDYQPVQNTNTIQEIQENNSKSKNDNENLSVHPRNTFIKRHKSRNSVGSVNSQNVNKIL